MQVWRNDRFGRGGDHTEFLNAGYPAVRFSVAVENYNQQHQDLRTEKGVEYGDTIDKMDFPYLEKVAKLNIAALAALASAPPPPEPKVEGAVSTDTTLKWFAQARSIDVEPGDGEFVIRWRRTDEANWTQSSKDMNCLNVSETRVPHVTEDSFDADGCLKEGPLKDLVTKLAHAFHDWVNAILRARQLLLHDAAKEQAQEKAPA